jgi:hypothetical protein
MGRERRGHDPRARAGDGRSDADGVVVIITAKFPSICPVCNTRIAPGFSVEWSQGSQARHVACHVACPSAAPKAPAPYVRYEKWKPCKRAALPNHVGLVRVAGAATPWAHVREGMTAEPVREGDAFVIVSQDARYESTEDNEDMGDCTGAGWHVTLHLRHATAEEAAPAVAKAAAERTKRDGAKVRTEQMRELTDLCRAGWYGHDNDAQRPVGRELVVDPGVHGSGRYVAILSADEGAVALWSGGHYDDYRSALMITRDPRAVELFLALAGV